MTTIEQPPYDLIEKYKDSEIRTEFAAFKGDVDGFSDENKELRLKTGDVILFNGGYNYDIQYKSEILGFNKSGYVFVLWDCYWYPIRLTDTMRKFQKL